MKPSKKPSKKTGLFDSSRFLFTKIFMSLPSLNRPFLIGRPCAPSVRHKIWHVPKDTHTTSCSAELTHLGDLFRNSTSRMETM